MEIEKQQQEEIQKNFRKEFLETTKHSLIKDFGEEMVIGITIDLDAFLNTTFERGLKIGLVNRSQMYKYIRIIFHTDETDEDEATSLLILEKRVGHEKNIADEILKEYLQLLLKR